MVLKKVGWKIQTAGYNSGSMLPKPWKAGQQGVVEQVCSVWSKSILPWKLVIFKWLMMKIWTMRYLSNLKRHIWSEEF